MRLWRRWRYTYFQISFSSLCAPSSSVFLPCFVGAWSARSVMVDRTSGLINTKSINKTTKSCSTYLSAKPLQFGHCVRRTPLPRARSSALEYVVYSTGMGWRQEMHIGIVGVRGSGREKEALEGVTLRSRFRGGVARWCLVRGVGVGIVVLVLESCEIHLSGIRISVICKVRVVFIIRLHTYTSPIQVHTKEDALQCFAFKYSGSS